MPARRAWKAYGCAPPDAIRRRNEGRATHRREIGRFPSAAAARIVGGVAEHAGELGGFDVAGYSG
jgi:hypothetical protein